MIQSVHRQSIILIQAKEELIYLNIFTAPAVDYNWGKAFFVSLDFPHLGYHCEDDVDIVGDSVVRPARVLELGHSPTFVFAVAVHFKSSLHTVVCKPVLFLLKVFIKYITSDNRNELVQMQRYCWKYYIIESCDFAILQRADLMVILMESFLD